MGGDAVRRDDVLAEVLVLVVAPEQNEIRLERIQGGPRPLHPADQRGAMRRGRRGALDPSPHSARMPSGHPSGVRRVRRQIRVLQHALQDCRHAVIVTAQRRVVRYSKCQNFCHDVLPGCLVASGARVIRRPDGADCSG